MTATFINCARNLPAEINSKEFSMKHMVRPLIIALTMILSPASSVFAQVGSTWSDRPIKIYATSPPGGSIDLLARMVATECSQSTGKTFIVENRAGANGNIAANMVVKGPPDGHQWFVTLPGVFSINQYLFKSMPFDSNKDILPVAVLGQSPLILTVNKSVPAKNFPDFLKWVKANPGKLFYSSAGVGTTGHLAMELLKQTAGLDISHIPYKGTAEANIGLISGEVQMSLGNTTSAFPHMKSGQILGLAVGQKQRIDDFPELPTIHESGVPNFEVLPWFALGTRVGVSKDIVDKVHACATASITKLENKKRLDNVGIIPQLMTQPEFAKYVQAESKLWGDVVRKSGASLD
jgi:tripartite-type tricarboxylate transporter receptor subunit TctC